MASTFQQPLSENRASWDVITYLLSQTGRTKCRVRMRAISICHDHQTLVGERES